MQLKITSKEDRWRLFDFLKIDGDSLRQSPIAHDPNAVNYGESKANSDSKLSDPLMIKMVGIYERNV
jgi:hypothetical protein